MDYRILGPLGALDGERQLPLGGARQRAVLALLLLHGNETLTRDVIVDELWGENAPPTAAKVLQNCVSALRKELPADTIRTVAGPTGSRSSRTSSTATASNGYWRRAGPP